MWLLDTKTATLHEFHDPRNLRYAILSHVWQDNEQTFQDLRTLASRYPESTIDYVSPKIRNCCNVAASDGYTWLWNDTCCINKTSSSELSEAINSMYFWYAHSSVCYAYLYDVSDLEEPSDKPSSFRSSRWFTRGWTLQELIAPGDVVFLSSSWRIIGTKAIYAQLVEEITGVDCQILTHSCALDKISVARRMSWAADRATTREEDRAYSLMGIFGVCMPTIYGEGRNAFLRLQEEILRRNPDQSLFAWGRSFVCDNFVNLVPPNDVDDPLPGASRTLFASSPEDFHGCGRITPIPYERYATTLNLRSFNPPDYRITSYGIRAELPLIKFQGPGPSFAGTTPSTVTLLILACQDEQGAPAALLLRPQPGAVGRYFVRAHHLPPPPDPLSRPQRQPNYRVTFLAHALIKPISCMVSQPSEVILHPHDPPTIHLPRAPSPPCGTGATPSLAFFVPHRVFCRLRTTAGLCLDSNNVGHVDRNGLLFELGERGAPEHETTASITFVSDGGGGTGKQDTLEQATAVEEDQEVTRHRASRSVAITITVGVPCLHRRHAGHSEDADRKETESESPDSELSPHFWFAIGRRVDCYGPEPDPSVHTVLTSPSPRGRAGGSGARAEDQRCDSSCAAGDRACVSPISTSRTPTTQTADGEVCHRANLAFDDGACRVLLGVRLWEKCHRSCAAFAYMLDVEVAGDVFALGADDGAT